MLSFFEVCAHPRHLTTRIDSSLYILDSIIRSLAMTHLDANDPTASKFVRRAVPAMKDSPEQSIFMPRSYPSSTTTSPTQQYVQQNQLAVDTTTPGSRCSCRDLSLGRQWPEAQTQVPLWASTPMWNQEWTEGEIKKEECRRLCWSALMLVSGQTSYADAVNWRIPDFFMVEPSNVGAILNRSQPLAKAAHSPRPLAVFHSISRRIVTSIASRDVFGFHEWQRYGLGALPPRDAALERMRADAERYEHRRFRQEQLCDAGVGRDGGDRKGTAVAHMRCRRGVHVPRTRNPVQVRGPKIIAPVSCRSR